MSSCGIFIKIERMQYSKCQQGSLFAFLFLCFYFLDIFYARLVL